ncbi:MULTISPECIES: ATP-binding protein [Leeuwenhoekiella]|uniref:ATP-binding protein n=1 Tax=Leeuwenhoekiella TaxID=283735 RepID=UPI000C547E73|nr:MULTISPECIES: hypothetical protein [Leeuwenhoekiella]MAO42129.1 hypothetical protein [Leeuwenhoekiella sp.]|tara:strand:+ start:55 stop:690 length:636 start_codon:yes stop_codon:yes gene_type:complete
MAKIKRAVSVDELLKKKFKTLPLEGRFKELIGTPERSGSWFLFGNSGEGKTTFLMQLAKYLTQFEKVEFNSLEEGARMSMQEAIKENRMQECRRGSFKVLDKLTIDEIRERQSRHKSAGIVIIDSVQYAFLDKRGYKALQKACPNTLFIWNSHAEGKQPMGSLAKAIMYDADVKLHCVGFRVFAKSRMNRGQLSKPYTVWEEGAKQYHDIL